jgi:signal peptidase I
MTHSATRIAITVIALLLLSGCSTSPHFYSVTGDSMRPLLNPGDKVYVDESAGARSDLHDGDIIVLRRGDAVVLKRILAMPGETIRGEQRKIFRDGKQVDEPYLAAVSNEDKAWMTTFPTRKVDAGDLFVLGDNRDLSFDSRAPEYAPVRFSDVVGKYRWTYWHVSASAKSKSPTAK